MNDLNERKRGIDGGRSHLFIAEAEGLDQLYRQVKNTAFDAQAIGSPLERGVREAVERILPQRLGTTSGYVVDHLGHSSRQTDCIIFDRLSAAPVPLPGGEMAITIDDTAAVIEVKARLTKKSLLSGIEQAATVKGLARAVSRVQALSASGVETDETPVRHPFAVLFAYRSSVSLASLALTWHEHYTAVPPGQQLDMIVVLDAGFLCLSASFPEARKAFAVGWRPMLNCGSFFESALCWQRHGVSNHLAFVKAVRAETGALCYRGDGLAGVDLLPNTALAISAAECGLYSWDQFLRWLLFLCGYRTAGLQTSARENEVALRHWPLAIVVDSEEIGPEERKGGG